MTVDREWTLHAACRQRDPEAFYPKQTDSIDPAITICDGCPVRLACLTYALEHEARDGYCYGVWGGTSANERARMLRLSPGPGRKRCPQCGQHVRALKQHTDYTHGERRARCGTAAGYHRHNRERSTVCRPCQDARNAYERGVRAKRKVSA